MDNILDKDYWKQRYQNADIAWDTGNVTTPIKEFVDWLALEEKHKKLKILIPGAGSGYEAIYLWEQGFHNVFICDWAEEAIERF